MSVLDRVMIALRAATGSRGAPDRQDDLTFFLRQWVIPGNVQVSSQVLTAMSPVRSVAPKIVNGLSAGRIAVIAPHPDDEMMGPGGAILRAVADGKGVTVIYLTDGESNPDRARMRRVEAMEIAGKLGYRAQFLGLPLGPAMAAPDHAEALSNALSGAAPDILLCPFVLDDNEDHQVANTLLLMADRQGRLAGISDIWAYQVYSMVPGNVLVPLGEFAERKAQAIRLYKSQAEIRDWATFALGLNAVNARFTPRSCLDPYVESFLALPAARYLDLARTFCGAIAERS